MPAPPHQRGIPPPPPHPGDGKRKAPISAGAFAFDLSKIGTPTKKARTVISGSTNLQTPLRQSSTSTLRPSSVSRTPQPKLFPAALGEYALPAVTPLKQVKPLGALPSPFAVTPARAGRTPDTSHKPLQSILDESSPFLTRPLKPGLQPKDGDKLVKIGQLATSKIDDTPRERVKREDEGVGVSPRKPRAIKWTGKGDMPASIHLAQILHTANSSLVLFYNSLQRILHPPARSAKPSFGGKYTSPDRTPTVVQHIRTAHIRLRPISLAWNRTHNGIVLKCEMVKRKDPPTEDMVNENEENTEECGKEGSDILLVLQPLPHECARLGVDPKVIVGKMREGTEKRWEIGVWAPLQEMDLASGPRSGLEEKRTEEAKGNEEDDASDEAAAPTNTHIIFASRYLIAEV